MLFLISVCYKKYTHVSGYVYLIVWYPGVVSGLFNSYTDVRDLPSPENFVKNDNHTKKIIALESQIPSFSHKN